MDLARIDKMFRVLCGASETIESRARNKVIDNPLPRPDDTPLDRESQYGQVASNSAETNQVIRHLDVYRELIEGLDTMEDQEVIRKARIV